MRKDTSGIRRGNTMVLAVGLLVLLAIIATSYLTLTHSSQITSKAQQYASLRDDNAQVIANSLANEIADSLFVRPVDYLHDPGILAGRVADPNFPRLPAPPGTARYMPDPGDYFNNTTGQANAPDGLLDFIYTTPPYQVVPWTNWPDNPPTIAGGNIWPINEDNPGNAGGGLNLYQLLGVGEGNPPGGPGSGDTRWLADTEPVRQVIGPGPDGFMGTSDDVVVFTHWRHMSIIARPNNGWRVCRFIADVFVDRDGDPNGIREWPNVVTDLSIPHEQWLSAVPQPLQFSPVTGDAILNIASFGDLWNKWLKLPGETGLRYADLYANPLQTPLNFYNLRDLNGNGIPHEPEERPLDEFVAGTARWYVGTVLADADGDGYTDSMWFLAPAGVDRSIRQVVAVRIIDNSAMLNVTLATRFVPSNDGDLFSARPYRTKGTTPADLAAAGALKPDPSPPGWNVGFLDNPEHRFEAPILAPPGWPAGTVQFYAHYQQDGAIDPLALWDRHLQEVGLKDLLLNGGGSRPDLVGSGGGEGPDLFLDEFERLDYWLGVGQEMLASESQFPPSANLTHRTFTPYGTAEELDLRMYHGNNNPWTYTRLEGATQPNSQNPLYGILHGGFSQDLSGSSEFLGKLLNADLVRDSRRKLTTYSGARNDGMPPWLWPGHTRGYWDFINDGFLNNDERRQLAADTSKYDLRRSFYRIDGSISQDVDGDGIEEPRSPQFPAGINDDLYPPEDLNPIDGLPDGDGQIDLRDHYARLQKYLEHVLVDVQQRSTLPPFAPTVFQSYFGDSIPNLKKTTQAAASLAANILAYRDADSEPLGTLDAVVAADPTVPYAAAQKYGYIGMEAQPFLVEAFVAHVYKYNQDAVYDHVNLSGELPIKKEDHIVCQSSPQGTVVAVQIANPYDRPVELGRFSLKVFGAELPFNNAGQAGLDAPLPAGRARTYYAMDTVSGAIAESKWIGLLGLVPSPDVEVIPLTTSATGAWKTTRGYYDAAAANDAVELIRYVDDGTGSPLGAPVVVDRIDIRPGGNEPPPPYTKFGTQIADADSLPGMAPPDGDCSEPAPLPGDTIAPPWPDVLDLCRVDPANPGGARICDTHLVYVSWASRAGQIDLDGNGTIDDNERNPRFVFANRRVQPLYRATFNENDAANLWFADDVGVFAAPPSFDQLNKGADVNDFDPVGSAVPIGDELDFPMQMLQKDGDFEQVGELYNVWLFGHELEYGAGALPSFQQKTRNTFSEFLWDEIDTSGISDADRSRVNRLRLTPAGSGSATINPFFGKPKLPWTDPKYLLDPAHATPRLTAGARALEAFVCDGPGAAFPDVNGDGFINGFDDQNSDGQIDEIDALLRSQRMAEGFSGRGTPGLINIETATLEVMQALPGWYRLIHQGNPNGPNPFVHLPQAVVRYRDRLGDPTVVEAPNIANLANLFDPLPSYGDRGIKPAASPGFLGPRVATETGVRQARGFASIGELGFLLRSGKAGKSASAAGAKYDASTNPGAAEVLYNDSFRADYASVPDRTVFQNEIGPVDAFLFPLLPAGLTGGSARVSTDVVPGFDPASLPGSMSDPVAEDVEEANLLVAGASNLVTTRSDVFTVYFKVRSFRQNPVTGRWDATDPEMIVDEARYVMLVDRSEVNHPGDKPRIVYLEKLPQ